MILQKVLFENSNTPIYQRIINAFIKGMQEFDIETKALDQNCFSSTLNYINYIKNNSIDTCIITNQNSVFTTYLKQENCFLFELLPCMLLFIHHENLVNAHQNITMIYNKFRAFQNVNQRSVHFCLEQYNVNDLKQMGIKNVFPIHHASEFTKPKTAKDYIHQCSFIGHAMPFSKHIFEKSQFGPLLEKNFSNKSNNFNYKIEPTSIVLANELENAQENLNKWFAVKYLYMSFVHSFSLFWRGLIMQHIKDATIDIYGGDPAYVHKIKRIIPIPGKHITYHPPLFEIPKLESIYQTTKINLNITSLQFDTTVINRVQDVGASGGFVLTDLKDDLHKITQVHREISFNTIEELNEKIQHYCSNEKLRIEIAEQLHRDIKSKFSYSAIVNYIISSIKEIAN